MHRWLHVLLQKPAAAALTNLLRGTCELKAAVASAPEAIASLVTALSAASLELQTVAAAALGELCARNAANKQAVAASPGALARLVAMLDTSDDSSSGSSESSSSVVGSAAGPPGGTAASVQVMPLGTLLLLLVVSIWKIEPSAHVSSHHSQCHSTVN
jgi:hypothetical protein